MQTFAIIFTLGLLSLFAIEAKFGYKIALKVSTGYQVIGVVFMATTFI